MFIWKLTWEPMSRYSIFYRVRGGALGLSHLFVRQIVSRVFLVRGQEQPFVRALIQTELSPHLPSYRQALTRLTYCLGP